MFKFTIFFMAILAANGAFADSKCLPWSDNCQPSSKLTYQMVVYYEQDRKPETTFYEQIDNHKETAETKCRIISTPWNPEKVKRIEITNTETGDKTVFTCP